MAETTTTETTDTTETTVTAPETESELGDGGKTALEAERRARRAADRDLKAAKAELDAIKASSMSDTEKAVAQAKAEGRSEGLRDGSVKIAQAEIRAAAAGRPGDIDALLEGVDAARFIGEDGEVDRDAIVGWVDKVVPVVPEPVSEQRDGWFPDLGQGTRGVPALNSDQLEKDLRDALHM